jgi:hypothetical protein
MKRLIRHAGFIKRSKYSFEVDAEIVRRWQGRRMWGDEPEEKGDRQKQKNV